MDEIAYIVAKALWEGRQPKGRPEPFERISLLSQEMLINTDGRFIADRLREAFIIERRPSLDAPHSGGIE